MSFAEIDLCCFEAAISWALDVQSHRVLDKNKLSIRCSWKKRVSGQRPEKAGVLTEVVDKDCGGLDKGKDGIFLKFCIVGKSTFCNSCDEGFWKFKLVNGICELLLLGLGSE